MIAVSLEMSDEPKINRLITVILSSKFTFYTFLDKYQGTASS